MVSIIVPIHNTPGNILIKCVESIMNQTYKSIELICVDDCSTNVETLEVEKEMLERYADNFKLVCLETNQGAAEARNSGFDMAQGEYTIFLDSDDFFAEDFIEKMYLKIIEHDSDICLCEYSVANINANDEILIKNKVKMDFEFADICGRDDMLIKIPASGCNRLCRTELLRDKNIKFQTLKSDNDLCFALKTVLTTDKITILHDSSLFYYRFDTDFQISANFNPLNLYKAIEETLKGLSNYTVYKNAELMIRIYAVVTGVYELKMSKNNEHSKAFYYLFRNHYTLSFPQTGIAKIDNYINNWNEKDFKSKWFLKYDDFLVQLIENTELIKREIDVTKDLYIWGLGKRGIAFEQWCKMNAIIVSGICDRNEELLKQESEHVICSTEYVKHSSGTIIATNHLIYSDIKKQIDTKAKVVDLEKYCPL